MCSESGKSSAEIGTQCGKLNLKMTERCSQLGQVMKMDKLPDHTLIAVVVNVNISSG